jgi:hypothetical protein
MKKHGYIITQPSIFKKDFIPHYHTFSESAGHAWRYFIGSNVDEMDVSTRIQAWHDRGYRVKRAVMEIEE